MCGRYTNRLSWADLVRLYGVEWPQTAMVPRYNAAPTQLMPAVYGQPRRMEMMSWGFLGPKGLLINARAETVGKLPTFRASFLLRRCLVPADGFYEWRKLGRERQPYFISLASGEPFSFAGVFDQGRFAIITTDANELVDDLHDRMPAILPRDAYDAWLSPATGPGLAKALLGPYPSEQMRMWPVSRRVNKAEPDEPGLIKKVPEERGLF